MLDCPLVEFAPPPPEPDPLIWVCLAWLLLFVDCQMLRWPFGCFRVFVCDGWLAGWLHANTCLAWCIYHFCHNIIKRWTTTTTARLLVNHDGQTQERWRRTDGEGYGE